MDNPLEKKMTIYKNFVSILLGAFVWLPSLDFPIASLPSFQPCTVAPSLTKSMRHGTLLWWQKDNYDNS